MAPNPIPPNVVPDQNRAPLVQPSRLWERVWFDWFLGIWKAVKVSVVAGPTGSIQYNDNGVQAGDANLLWDKDKHTESIQSITGESALRLKPSLAFTPWNLASYAEINFGHYVADGNYIPTLPRRHMSLR